MTGDALVVDRRHLAPGGERVDAVGQRPPHPARPGEVLGRARCSRRRRRWSAPGSTRSGGSARGCRSGRRPGRRWCGRRAACIQSRNSSRLPSRRAGSASRAATASETLPPGTIRLLVATMSSVSRFSSSQPHAVGLLEVDGGAEELARRQGVPLAPDRLAVATARRELGLEPAAELGVRRAGGARRAATARRGAPPVPRRRGWRRSRRSSPSWPVQRRTWPAISAYCRFATTRPRVGLAGQRRPVAGQGVGDAGQPGGDVVPALLGVGGHQVERLADRVRPAADHRELAAARSRPRPSRPRAPTRSRNASRATASRSSTGTVARIRSSARRAASSRASKPSGERSGSSWSWPAMPA